MMVLRSFLRTFAADCRAVTALEYGLIAALIAVTIMVAVAAVGTGMVNTLTTVSNYL